MNDMRELTDFTPEETEIWLRDQLNREPDDELVRAGSRTRAPDNTESTREYSKIEASAFRWRDPKTFPLRPWLYGTVYIRNYLTVTAGPGGFGKSSLVLVEALAMVTGRSLLGIQVTEPLRCWYVNLEDPLEEVERRVMAICIHFGITEAEIGGRLFLNSGDDCSIIVMEETRDGAKIVRPVVEALIGQMQMNAIDILMLDPFASTHGIDENSNPKINAVKNTFASIARQANASVSLVHHVRKGASGQGEYTIDDSRGAKALIDGARIGRILNGMTKDEGEQAGVENHRTHFHIMHGKANLAPASDRRDWFHIKSVSLGNGLGELGGLIDVSDHVGVVEPWIWPDPQKDVTVAHLRDVQAAVAAGRWRENHQAKDWVGHAVAQVLKLDPANKAHKRIITGNIKTWLATGMLVIVEGEDEKRNKRPFVEVGTPATD